MRHLLTVAALVCAATTAHGQVPPLSWADERNERVAPQFLDVQSNRLDASAASQPTTRLAMERAATQPEATSAAEGYFPAIGGTFGLEEFIQHFAPYEPMYFVGGSKAPNIKFQFSIRYRIFTPQGSWATAHPWLRGFNFAYSQTSFWDWSHPSTPFFFDSSYRPEFFYYLEHVPGLELPPGWQLGLQGGIGHESNGDKPPNHRGLNIIYLRPIFTASHGTHGLFFTFAPKIYDYIGSVSDNPNIAVYRGYADLEFIVGQRDGLQLSVRGRIGSDFNKGSALIDLTYPLTKLTGGNIDLYLDAQYFVGYGDSLLDYNKYASVFRFGVSLVR